MVALQSPDQMQAQQYATDTALQNIYNTNASNATQQYNSSVTAANNAQNDLSNFTKNMVSGNDAYNQSLSAANANAGYNVNDLNNAQNQVSQITGILGGLPRAVQASNANYGATAGNVAAQYSTEGSNLNQSLSLANQNAANEIAKQNAGLTGAQNNTTDILTGQDQQRQSYAATAANAAQIMATSQTQMNQMIAAQQQGQQLTANDQNTFAQLKASYAAAAEAYAAASNYAAQAATTNYNLQQAQAANAKAAAATTATTAKAATAPKTQDTETQAQINADIASGGQSGLPGFLNTAGSDTRNVLGAIGNWFTGN